MTSMFTSVLGIAHEHLGQILTILTKINWPNLKGCQYIGIEKKQNQA